jgi:signal recognition particle receptor subunit beta
MPTIDAVQGVLVVRIVYDGPAFSGKTTSLKSLAQGVASHVECPAEQDGRTLYFDWMEYVGGLFEGRQIKCQIVSVPGQRELAHRRDLLLESADAVVCVLDTRSEELEFGLSWLRELTLHCRGGSPPVGIVLQANKRDAPSAVPREELRVRVAQVAPIAVVESVATSADGIREAFVMSVRLALDRVRALSMEGRLEAGEPSELNADDLLQKLRRAEADSVPVGERPSTPLRRSEPPPTPLPRIESSPAPPAQAGGDDDEDPFVPDPLIPGGMIWPPVDGRALLHEVSGLGIEPKKTPAGYWWGSGAGWRFHSSPNALHADPNAAREQLIGWARLHSANAALLSPGRAVILAEAGRGRLRVWQLVRVESALRERLDGALSASTTLETSEGIVEVATQLLAAREWFSSGSLQLPCTLWTVSAARAQRPYFVGLMPTMGSKLVCDPEGSELLERELLIHLRALRRTRVDFGEVRRLLLARAEGAAPGSTARLLAEVVRSVD